MQVRYLIAPGTIDDAMWPLLGRKLQVVGRALDGNATGSATGDSPPTLPSRLYLVDGMLLPLLSRKLQVVGRALDGNAISSATGDSATHSCFSASSCCWLLVSPAVQKTADSWQSWQSHCQCYR